MIEPVKDLDGAHPIPEGWRSTLREVANALAEGDFSLTRAVSSVAPVPARMAESIQWNITSYGEALAPLSEQAWESSQCQWYGSHWYVLVDLWTVQSGRSDLVLFVRVFEVERDFRFEIESVHVP